MMLWLLRLLGFARKAAQALFALAVRYPCQAALIALLCASFWLWQGKREAVKRADNLALQLDTQRRAYTEAQRQAAILARAAREAQERRYKEQADEADKKADGLRADLRDAGARYAAANSLRRACPAGGASGGTLAAAQGDAAESSNGPGADAVVLSRDDFDILNENTARLIAVREWALGL